MIRKRSNENKNNDTKRIKRVKMNIELLYKNACEKKMFETASFISNQEQFNPAYIYNDYSTPLILACQYRLNNVAINLINTGKAKPEFVKNKKNSALIWACKNSMENVINAIIDTDTGKTNINYVNENNKNALMFACRNKLDNVAIKLIENENNINLLQRDKKNKTAFDYAIEKTYNLYCMDDAIEMMLKKNNSLIPKNDNFLMYCLNNDLEKTALFLVKNCTQNMLDYIDEYGNTVLITACNNNLNTISLTLLERNFTKLHHRNSYNFTALLLACKYSMPAIAMKIIEKTNEDETIHFGTYDQSKQTPLYFACSNNLPTIAKKLIQSGKSNPKMETISNHNALYWACNMRLNDIAIDLLDIGLNNETDIEYAFKNNMEDVIIKYIENYGISRYVIINSINYFCNSAIDKIIKVMEICSYETFSLFTTHNLRKEVMNIINHKKYDIKINDIVFHKKNGIISIGKTILVLNKLIYENGNIIDMNVSDKISVENIEICAICRHRISQIMTDCGHQYCENCFHRWNKICALCRNEIQFNVYIL